MLPIATIAEQLGLLPHQYIPYGHYKAKLDLSLTAPNPKGKLILVTAITPNKAGVGKTTTSIGLVQGFQALGKKAIAALREPSLGPCFGMKGGATGGGKAQLLPADDINLHFTGDFHAITTAHNMLAALFDNHRFVHPEGARAIKQVLWKRVLDINDRSLRYIVTGLHGTSNGIPAESGFDITPASEIMALLCLATSYEDFSTRLSRIVLGYCYDGSAFTVADLGVTGALMALLKEAMLPNLVQTTEGAPVLVHGGPFANIAHGCNSVAATRMALSLADYVVTEAGFGADLGAEKFLHIKCRSAGIWPSATVIVVSSQALKLHGGTPESAIREPDQNGMLRGLANLERHIENMQAFGQPVVVAFNTFPFDLAEEIELVRTWCTEKNARFAENKGYLEGGKGSTTLAETILGLIDRQPAPTPTFHYALNDSLVSKLEAIVRKVYRGNGIRLSKKAAQAAKKMETQGWGSLPVCIAKTQYSFSGDASATGVAEDFVLEIEDLVLNAGAGFVVAVAGDIMRMPGLPKTPQAMSIRLENGVVHGLS